MNLKNISRDSFWVEDTDGKIAWSTTSGNVKSSGVVNSSVASVYSSGTSGASGNFSVGVLIEGTKSERIPYRVKAYVPTNDVVYLLIGYAPASPTGDDAPSTPLLHQLVGEIDEVFMMPAQDGGSFEDRAIIFGIYTGSVAIFNVSLSVQKLDVSPPSFGLAVP
jgi:hypothetical protein